MSESVVEVKNLKASIMALVAAKSLFKIRLNSGGWSGNIYTPMYGQKIEDITKDNVLVFQDGDEWRIGTVKTVNVANVPNGGPICIHEIKAKAGAGHKVNHITIENVICRLKKIYTKPKATGF